MTKRFTATEKWDDPWFRKLEPEYKLFWLYLLDKCDHSGVWNVDIEHAEFEIRAKIDENILFKKMEGRLKKLNDDYWLIPKYIDFQFGELTDNNKLHKHVLGLIEKHRVSKGYPSPLQGAKDNRVKDKEKVKEVVSNKLTDVQKVVTAFKMVSGFEKDDKNWDRTYFPRFSKSAKALIDFLGSWEASADCIQDIYERLTSKGLSVTLETIIKHAGEWKKDQQEKGESYGILSV